MAGKSHRGSIGHSGSRCDSIEEARVQWVAEQTFGVEFQKMQAEELDELEELINEFDDTQESGHA